MRTSITSRASPRAKHALQVPVYLHRDDQFLYDAAPQQAAFFGLHCDPLPPDRSSTTMSRKSLSFGDYEVADSPHAGPLPGRRVSGHRQAGVGERGSLCRRYAVCRIDRQHRSARRRSSTLIRSITEVLFAFGDDARVLLGARSRRRPSATSAATNPFLRSGPVTRDRSTRSVRGGRPTACRRRSGPRSSRACR